MSAVLTASEEAVIKERHRPVVIKGEPFTNIRTGEKGIHPDRLECGFCDRDDWPCDAARLLLSFAAVEAASSSKSGGSGGEAR